MNGSYAEYVVTPSRYTSRIPDGLPDEIAGPICEYFDRFTFRGRQLIEFVSEVCSGSTMYTALKVSKVQAGCVLLVSHSFPL